MKNLFCINAQQVLHTGKRLHFIPKEPFFISVKNFKGAKDAIKNRYFRKCLLKVL